MLKGLIGTAELAELVDRHCRFEQRLRPAALPRLNGLSAEVSPTANNSLLATAEFGAGAEDFPVLRITVTGIWPLVCQRCLGAVACDIAVDSELTLLTNESDMQVVADPFDALVVAAEGLRLLDVIEDEILAALPMAPVHEELKECSVAAEDRAGAAANGKETNKPFAGLAELMGSASTDNTG